MAAEAGARAEQLTITRSNRGYLRLGHTDNWHETEPGAATEVTQIRIILHTTGQVLSYKVLEKLVL